MFQKLFIVNIGTHGYYCLQWCELTGKLQLQTAFFGRFGLVGPHQCSVADQSKYSDEPHPLLVVCALVYQLFVV